MNCIVCSEASVVFLFKKGFAEYFKCKKCGLVFQHPMPKEIDIEEYYGNGEKYWSDERHSLHAKNSLEVNKTTSNFYISIIKSHIILNKKMSVLDFGCGVGVFLNQIKPYVGEVKGIDMSSWSAKYALDNFSIDVKVKSLDELNEFKGKFDLITMWQTLEHITNPNELINRLKIFLKPEGYIVIGVPNVGSLFAKILGKHWGYYNIDEHVVLFSPKTIKLFMARQGFSLIKTYKYSYSKETLVSSLVKFLVFFTNRLVKRLIYKSGLRINIGPIKTDLWKKNERLVRLPMQSSKDCMISLFKNSI